jgi:hypothetical protein
MELQHFMHEHQLSLNVYMAFFGIRPHCKWCLNEILAGSSYSCERCSFFDSFKNHVVTNPARCSTNCTRNIFFSLEKEKAQMMSYVIFATTIYIHTRASLTIVRFHCNFIIHLKCASIPLTVEAEFYDHPLKLLRKSVSFTCDVCGKEDKDMSYLCITCSLMVHLKCATYLTKDCQTY